MSLVYDTLLNIKLGLSIFFIFILTWENIRHDRNSLSKFCLCYETVFVSLFGYLYDFSRVKCMSVPVYSSLVVLKPKIPENKYQINYYIIFNRYPLHHHIAEIIPQNSIFMDSAPNHFGNLHKPI